MEGCSPKTNPAGTLTKLDGEKWTGSGRQVGMVIYLVTCGKKASLD